MIPRLLLAAVLCPIALVADYSYTKYLTAPSRDAVAQAETNTAAQECEDLRKDVNELRQDIAEIKALLKGNQPAEPEPQGWKPAPVIQAKCVSCHNANKKSGGLDYTDPDQYRNFIHEGLTRVMFGQKGVNIMPPAGGMTDDEITNVGLAAEATLR